MLKKLNRLITAIRTRELLLDLTNAQLMGYKQNSRSKNMTLIQNITENRLRRASGSVDTNHSFTEINITAVNSLPPYYWGNQT